MWRNAVKPTITKNNKTNIKSYFTKKELKNTTKMYNFLIFYLENHNSNHTHSHIFIPESTIIVRILIVLCVKYHYAEFLSLKILLVYDRLVVSNVSWCTVTM